jgi:hypothetical protein
MSFLLPINPIPDEMYWLLGNRFHNNNRKLYNLIAEEINKSATLRVMLPKWFSQYIKNGNLESMLNAIGWNGYRDRLASVYIYKKMNGEFPDYVNAVWVEDIINFEKKLIDHIPEGDSRVFVLGFYLKLCEIKLLENGLAKSLLTLSSSIQKILALGTKKIPQLDWFVLTLILLANEIGEDQVYKVIVENKGSYHKVFSTLNLKQKETIMANLLAYGASINEDEIFLDEKV